MTDVVLNLHEITSYWLCMFYLFYGLIIYVFKYLLPYFIVLMQVICSLILFFYLNEINNAFKL